MFCGLSLLTAAAIAVGIRWGWRAEPQADAPAGVSLPFALRCFLALRFTSISGHINDDSLTSALRTTTRWAVGVRENFNATVAAGMRYRRRPLGLVVCGIERLHHHENGKHQDIKPQLPFRWKPIHMINPQSNPGWRRITVISIACVVILSAVLLVRFMTVPNPVSIDIDETRSSTSTNQFVNVRFRSSSKRSYVGWFVTEVLVGGRWVESASQHSEVRMAMSVGPKYQAVYLIPIPSESAEWRVRWQGERDGGEVSHFRKMMARFFDRPFFRDTLHIRFSILPTAYAFGYSTNQVDF